MSTTGSNVAAARTARMQEVASRYTGTPALIRFFAVNAGSSVQPPTHNIAADFSRLVTKAAPCSMSLRGPEA